MTRWRLVTKTAGRHEHVSSVVLSEEEAVESLDVERLMHEQSGWTVTPGENLIVCRRGDLTRVVEIREYDALTDERREP